MEILCVLRVKNIFRHTQAYSGITYDIILPRNG